MDLLAHILILLAFLNLSFHCHQPADHANIIFTTRSGIPVPERFSLSANHLQNLITKYKVLDLPNFRSNQHASFRYARHFSSTYKHLKTKQSCLSKLLILLASDVESNPGPETEETKWPCKECHEECTWKKGSPV